VCWSETADLAAGGAVSAIGVACLAGVRRARDLPMASLPLLLGAHQLIESVVWRGEEGEVAAGTAQVARTAWAVIALPLLPALVPLAVLLAASAAARRRLVPLVVTGLATAGVLTYYVATRPVTAHVRGHTLGYGIGLPHVCPLMAGYLVATVGALLLSGDRVLRLLGVLTAAGAAGCAALWRLEFISTWCAFAAVVSVVLLRWVRTRAPAHPPGRTSRRGPRACAAAP
jgi:hypothetical protein